jgi:hypothetical protein
MAMAVIVADCPRCRAKKMTMDVLSSVIVGIEYDWQPTAEAFCVCRNCGKATIYLLVISNYDFVKTSAGMKPYEFKGSLMPFIDEPERYISLRDMGAQSPPDYVAPDVANAFNQGATCFAVECWDAAAAMFRKSIDLATRPMLPEAEEEGLNAKVRRDLGLRLPWLFKTNRLPSDLKDLSVCIREDGNDGAHAGALNKIDAEDVLDFTRALLERIYTEPERLKIATARRAERRKPKE